MGARDVVDRRVTDHRRLGGLEVEHRSRQRERRRVGLGGPDLLRDRDRLELGLEPGDCELAPLQLGRPVRQEPDAQASRPHHPYRRDRVVEESQALDRVAFLLPVGLEQGLVEVGPRRDRVAQAIPAVLPERKPALEVPGPVRLEDAVVPAPELVALERRHVGLDHGRKSVPGLPLGQGRIRESAVQVEEDAAQRHPPS